MHRTIKPGVRMQAPYSNQALKRGIFYCAADIQEETWPQAKHEVKRRLNRALCILELFLLLATSVKLKTARQIGQSRICYYKAAASFSHAYKIWYSVSTKTLDIKWLKLQPVKIV